MGQALPAPLWKRLLRGKIKREGIDECNLKAIKFNHNPNSADHDAVNIRKNKTGFINVPEWVQGISTKAEDSLAAYAIKETKGSILTIQARFQADAGINQAEIRAIYPTVTPSGCIGWIIKIYIAIFGHGGEGGKGTVLFFY